MFKFAFLFVTLGLAILEAQAKVWDKETILERTLLAGRKHGLREFTPCLSLEHELKKMNERDRVQNMCSNVGVFFSETCQATNAKAESFSGPFGATRHTGERGERQNTERNQANDK